MVTRRAAKAAAKTSTNPATAQGRASKSVAGGVEAALLAAVDIARNSIDGTPSAATGAKEDHHVGRHLAARLEADGLAVHEFECTNPAYPHWLWTVVLALAEGESEPTVCDVVLLPGANALIPPAWVPWHERLQPGDLRPGDVIPTDPADPRLIPGYTGEGDIEGAAGEQLADVVWELGLGRERVLSPEGRDEAAMRWHDGATGPAAPEARLAPKDCGSCGFMVPIGGHLGQAFAICANIISPADGKVVSLGFGCGAHSEITATPTQQSAASAVVDTIDFEDLDIVRE